LGISGLISLALLRTSLSIIEPGVGEPVWQMVFVSLHVVDEAAESGTTRAASSGAGSGNNLSLAAVALEGDLGRMPLVDRAERDLASLVARFDTLDDLLRHRLLPLPAVRRNGRRPTRDSVVTSLQLQLLYHVHGAFSLGPGALSYGTAFLSLSHASGAT
jgi:hypothetical protein